MASSGTDPGAQRAGEVSSMVWQGAPAVLGIISAGIGVYQIASGNPLGAAFSFFMAATFVLSFACERAIVRARRGGGVVPASLLILFCGMGVAIGGSLVLGTLVAMRALQLA